MTFATYQRWTLPEPARTLCLDVILQGNEKRFVLHAAVVMPDHVHVVFTPLTDDNGPFSIAQIMQAIKGASAHRINAALRSTGRVWQEESFDRVLRREEHIGDKLDYILGNPVRAGLARLPGEYPWLWPR